MRFRQLHLFVLDKRVVFGVHRGQIGFQTGADGCILFDRNLVFQLDDARIHSGDFGAHRLQRRNSTFAFGQRVAQIDLDLGFLDVQHVQLALQQPHDHIGFRNQILQFVINRRGAHTFLPQGVRPGG